MALVSTPITKSDFSGRASDDVWLRLNPGRGPRGLGAASSAERADFTGGRNSRVSCQPLEAWRRAAALRLDPPPIRGARGDKVEQQGSRVRIFRPPALSRGDAKPEPAASR